MNKTEGLKMGSSYYILCVDDDTDFLRSLETFLPEKINSKNNDDIVYHFEFINNPAEVITHINELIAEKENVAMVISDQKMPSIEGIDLLALVKEKFPMIKRVLFTGHAGLEIAIKAINSNILDKYLLKPIDDINDFIVTIKNILNSYQLKKRAEQETTARKLAEKQLIQADKMATLGILITSIAHEISNPNNFILLNSEILLQVWNEEILPILDKYHKKNKDFDIMGCPYTKGKREIETTIFGLQDGGRRIKEITQCLKTFGRQDSGCLTEIVDINNAIKSSLPIINSLIKMSTNNFSTNLQTDLPKIKGNCQQLEQVIINLLSNSCHSLPDKHKSISITTFYNTESNKVTIKVTDEGKGIAKENLSRIMDPFFTTKQDMGGTGLGLSVSCEIIQNHGGEMKFSSDVDKGTDVTINFPVEKKISGLSGRGN